MTHKFTLRNLLLAFGCIFAFTASAQVVINEFSAANKSQWADATGANEDWIELYNAGSSAVNLAGYHLSDNRQDPTKWAIPAGVTINAGSRRFFVCSGKDALISGQYHTNFKFTQSNNTEEVVFTDPLGNFLDSLDMIPMRRNHSRGRTTDGAATWSVFETPAIPGTVNANAKGEYVPRPQFSLAAGFYTGNQTLTLTCPLANTTIYYTTNGAQPTNVVSGTNFQYNGPINLTQTRVVRARAFDNANQRAGSFTETNTIFINEPASTFPIWSISGPMTTFFQNGNETVVSIEYFGTNNQRLFQFEGDIRRHGNDSWAFPQKGMRMYVRDDYGYANKIDYQMFPTSTRTDFDVIILKAAGSDNFPEGGINSPQRCTHNRDQYVQTLSEKFDLNIDVRRFKNAITYVNGQYWGVYDTRERIDVDYVDHYYDAQEKWVDMLEYWGGMQIVAGSDTAWNNLFTFITTNNMANNANYANAISRLDPLSLIDYFVLNTYTVNSDWLNWNTAWWRSRKPSAPVRWRYKLWDQDNTFNLGENYTGLPTTSNTADPCDAQTIGTFANTNNPQIGHVKIFNSLMNNPQFEQLYINRYADLINTAFVCPTMLTHFDTMIARIAPEMPRQVARWGSTVTQWNSAVQYTRNQIAGRCNVVTTGLGPCYNVTGPYPVKVNVSPACAGKVKVNTTTPDEYPFTGSYYGGINVSFQALPATGWQFVGWQLQGHTVQPSLTADSIWFDLGTTGDSIVAVFTQVTPTPANLTVNIVGNNPGTVTVNGQAVTNGQVVPFNLGTQLNLVAAPLPTCTFNKWMTNHAIIYPTDTTETARFCFRQADTLTVVFDNCAVVDTDYLTVIIQQPGWGTVSINSIPVPAPITLPIPKNTALNLVAAPLAGYTFSNWILSNHTLAPNATSPNASFTITQDDTLIALFTQVIDTFELTVLVNPAGGGNVTVNGNALTTYPTVLKFADGTVINATETTNGGFTFANWTLFNHTLAPNNTSSAVNFTITQNDTLIANYTPIVNPDTFELTVLVNPIGGGNVSLNGVTPPSYPTILKYVDGTLINLQALANGGFNFTSWTLFNHTLNPNNTSANASFNITANDTLIANFTAVINPDTFDLTVLVNPIGGGNVSLNGVTPPSYPVTLKYVDGTLINLQALPSVGFNFTSWTLLNHTLNPNNTAANASFIITQNDTLLANFTAVVTVDTFDVVIVAFPGNGGAVNVNGTNYSAFPTTIKAVENSVLNFTATPNGGFAFNNWYVVYQTPQPSNTANPMNFTVTQSDTVYVYFDAIPTYNVVIQSFPATGGSVTVNGTNYTTFPSTVTVQQNTNLSFTANPNVGFTYSNWYVVYQNPLPSATSNPMNFNVTQNDTVYVYYNVIPPDSFNIVVDVKPNIFAGDVKVAGFTPPSYPYSFLFESGTNVDFEATGNTVNASSGAKTYAFDRYDFIYHTPTPNELQPIVFINVQYPDTVVAYFKVTEQNTDTLAQVLIPSGFSPEGDGANDNFNVFVLPKGVFFKEYNMQVFNRWGQKVFESNNQTYSWNGEFGEKKCDIGAYGYILTGKLTNGDEVKKSGTVTLLR